MTTKQSLDNFIQEQHDALDRFRLDWLRVSEDNPEAFPLELSPGAWEDQFMIFIGINA